MGKIIMAMIDTSNNANAISLRRVSEVRNAWDCVAGMFYASLILGGYRRAVKGRDIQCPIMNGDHLYLCTSKRICTSQVP